MDIAIPSNQTFRPEQRLGRAVVFPDWLVYVFVFTVFSKKIGHVELFGIDFDIIGYTFCVFYLVWNISKLYVSQSLMLILFTILITSMLAKLYLNLPFAPLWKQFAPLCTIVLANYDFFRRFNNFKRLFDVYVNIAFLTAVFGLIQLMAKAFFDFSIFSKYGSVFVDSVAYEPSHYSSIILPACVYALLCFRTDKLRCAIILLAAIGTFTATTYIVLMVVLVLIYVNPFYLLLMIPILYYLFNNVFLGIDKFESRFMGFSDYMAKGKLSSIKSATSLSFISNFEVARFTLEKSPLIGSGLGGNEFMYERYFSNDGFRSHYLYGLNAPSAHNLFIRIFSEMGILGGLIYIYMLIKALILKGPLVYRVISIACFSHFLCKALKLGGYFDYGTPFFIMMMWFCWKEFKTLKKEGSL